ncbi:MAG: peptidylprolyl isomerase [Planctomycetes bacterium]|nr:peptidylprolyl isomerase [Planctomycetota bacterium]MCB9868594.1 peptidylprolyl isomerase [Planctomycetota bacterium]
MRGVAGEQLPQCRARANPRGAARAGLQLAVLTLFAACVAEGRGDSVPGRGDAAVGRAEKRTAEPVEAAARRDTAMPLPVSWRRDELSPGVLLPSAAADAEVVKIEGVSVRKSHLYDRLVEEHPKGTRAEIDHLVFDILLAKQAERYGIRVDQKRIDALVGDEEARLTKRVEKDWGSVDAYLQAQFGVDLETHRRLARRRLARRMYRYYVVRYLALREDRVQVRVLAHQNRQTVERIFKQVREGADFHELAQRESEDRSQHRGGLLPPFPRGSKNRFAKVGFALKPGEVSEIQTVRSGGATRYFLVYCVRHMPGRDVTFAGVRAELDRDQAVNPVTAEEQGELYLRLRTASEESQRPSAGR